MSDSTSLAIGNRIGVQSPFTSHSSNSISEKSVAAPCQLLTVFYNPAVHPRQISLLDANGQTIHYTLVRLNQGIPVQIPPQLEPEHNAVVPISMNIPPNANACCICGNYAVDKCSYGASRGKSCGRFLCLSPITEVSYTGGRYPHCPEHFQKHLQE